MNVIDLSGGHYTGIDEKLAGGVGRGNALTPAEQADA